MTNMQLVLTIFVAVMFPTTTALIGILLNRKDAQELRGEMSNVRERLKGLETELKNVPADISEIKNRLTKLELQKV